MRIVKHYKVDTWYTNKLALVKLNVCLLLYNTTFVIARVVFFFKLYSGLTGGSIMIDIMIYISW